MTEFYSFNLFLIFYSWFRSDSVLPKQNVISREILIGMSSSSFLLEWILQRRTKNMFKQRQKHVNNGNLYKLVILGS